MGEQYVWETGEPCDNVAIDTGMYREDLTLQKLPLQNRMVMQGVNLTEFRITPNVLRGQMIAQLYAYVMATEAQVLNVTFTEEVPADWWQQLKQERAPTWFLRRWPVKMRTREVLRKVKAQAIFPHFNRAWPDEFGRAGYMVQQARPEQSE